MRVLVKEGKPQREVNKKLDKSIEKRMGRVIEDRQEVEDNGRT